MEILRKDISIVKEFLNTTDNVLAYVSPFKCIRLYSRKDSLDSNHFDYKGYVLVLTPTMRNETSALDFYRGVGSAHGMKLKCVEHKRDTNFVYTLEEE
jgi:hypothetical protein